MSRQFTARAALATECDAAGRTRLTRLSGDGPLAPRESSESCGMGRVVYLVGAAAVPLGGDDLELDLDVGPGSCLTVRSAAATVALPGRGESSFTVRARVGAGASLDFAPEPTVAAAGCRHRVHAEVILDAGARLRWREELVLGRHGEPPGHYLTRLDVTVDGAPLLRHELSAGDPIIHASPAVLGSARAAGTTVLADPGVAAEPMATEGLSVMPLNGPGALICALAQDATSMRSRLSEGEALARFT